jgi:hypothetical protein
VSTAADALQQEEYGFKLGPIKILKGVSAIHVMALFFCSFFGIAVMSYMNAGQPLIFGEILGVAEDDFGNRCSDLYCADRGAVGQDWPQAALYGGIPADRRWSFPLSAG